MKFEDGGFHCFPSIFHKVDDANVTFKLILINFALTHSKYDCVLSYPVLSLEWEGSQEFKNLDHCSVVLSPFTG